ncbi:MAG: acetyl-CoA acetyltransferase [Intestinimonas sp.]|nr:acetyl-CoA acetyltransferase [Intestinimonas sp.]
MRSVGICGIGHTKFGEYPGSFLTMLCQAALEAMDDAGTSGGPHHVIDQILVSTMGAGILNHQSGVASAVADALALCPAMAETVENGPASGGSALKLGYMAIASGLCDCVLVVGGDQMTRVPGPVATDFVATMLHPEAEYRLGLTLPAFVGMFTRLLMDKNGITPRDLALLAVKNHANAMLNPLAQLHKPVALSDLMDKTETRRRDRIIADPLRLYDACPISDGAAAAVLCAMDRTQALGLRTPVRIAGIASATDTHVVANRADPTRLDAVRISAQHAYQMAGLHPADVDVAELHDAFLILELAESEEAGLFPRGTSHLALRRGETAIGGRLPINPSGGLKAKGHPLGATGISQVVELVHQLRGEAGERQVPGARTGLAINFGGFGNNVVSTLVTTRKEDA